MFSGMRISQLSVYQSDDPHTWLLRFCMIQLQEVRNDDAFAPCDIWCACHVYFITTPRYLNAARNKFLALLRRSRQIVSGQSFLDLNCSSLAAPHDLSEYHEKPPEVLSVVAGLRCRQCASNCC